MTNAHIINDQIIESAYNEEISVDAALYALELLGEYAESVGRTVDAELFSNSCAAMMADTEDDDEDDEEDDEPDGRIIDMPE